MLLHVSSQVIRASQKEGATGLRLIHMMVRQLNAEMIIDNEAGTQLSLVF